MTSRVPLAVASTLVVIPGLLSPAGAMLGGASAASTTRVSVSSAERQANRLSKDAALSANGRYVVFSSNATNLVPHDHNGLADVFIRDRTAGTTRRVSIPNGGGQANGPSREPRVSADGRFVVFVSPASNLVGGDTNDKVDIVLRDLNAGTNRLVSVSSTGEQARRGSSGPQISRTGRYVAFLSYAPNLVADDGNRSGDVFLRDLVTGTTTLVSVSTSGEQAEHGAFRFAMSADGHRVAFESYSSNLVPHDTNDSDDVFVRDLTRGTTRRVSVSSTGRQSVGDSYEPAISGDGRFVAFVSYAGDLVPGDTNGRDDVFVRNLRLKRTTRVTVSSAGRQANENSMHPAISADGRFVAFGSWASNLVPGDTTKARLPEDVKEMDVFVRDRLRHTTRMVSVSTGGSQGTWGSYGPEVSGSGRLITFVSYAPNLVPRDTNRAYDVFVRDQGPIG